MYHIKPLKSLHRFIKNYNAGVQIAFWADTVQILRVMQSSSICVM